LLSVAIIVMYCTSPLGENDIFISCYMSDWLPKLRKMLTYISGLPLGFN